jgi:hypothetical protein
MSMVMTSNLRAAHAFRDVGGFDQAGQRVPGFLDSSVRVRATTGLLLALTPS